MRRTCGSTETEKTHDEIVRVETIAVLEAVELAVVACNVIFREVAGGEPLDPQRAENLAAKSAALLERIVEIRNTLSYVADACARSAEPAPGGRR